MTIRDKGAGLRSVYSLLAFPPRLYYCRPAVVSLAHSVIPRAAKKKTPARLFALFASPRPLQLGMIKLV